MYYNDLGGYQCYDIDSIVVIVVMQNMQRYLLSVENNFQLMQISSQDLNIDFSVFYRLLLSNSLFNQQMAKLLFRNLLQVSAYRNRNRVVKLGRGNTVRVKGTSLCCGRKQDQGEVIVVAFGLHFSDNSFLWKHFINMQCIIGKFKIILNLIYVIIF